MGQFRDHGYDGYGIYICDGFIVHSQFKNDAIEGYGFYKSIEGDEYDGHFKDDKFDGYGVLKFPNG